MVDDRPLSIEESNPLFQTAVLKHLDELGASRPEVSLHLLVKNGASCVPRLLQNVGRYLDEIVAVVNDTTDRTVEILDDYARTRGEGFRLEIVEVTTGIHPELYIFDAPETYQVGESLTGESCPGPHSDKPLLADWAGARNLGWSRCTKPWILFLDADDVVVDPECIPGMCATLANLKVEMAATRYIYATTPGGASQADSYRERLVRNRPEISWVGPVHETLRGQAKTAYVKGNLVVRDMKDNEGDEVRVPGRCLKILYHHARSHSWNVSPRCLFYLALECRNVLPDFALVLIDRYLDASLWPEERAWACAVAGELHEGRRDFARASGWYERSLSEHPGSKSAFRLCRSRFHEGRWRDVVDAYEVGVANQNVLQLLDNGPAYEDMSKILVAAAWDKLGEPRKALQSCLEALVAFPENSNLLLLRDQLKKAVV